VREIKFRGKILSTGEWVYGGIEYQSQIGKVYIAQDVGGITCVEVDPTTVGQYINLHAIGNIEIYEEDIIQGMMYPDKTIVMFDRRYATFKGQCGTKLIQLGYECEIVDNIYEDSSTPRSLTREKNDMNKTYTYYAPTYLAEKDPNDTRCTLLIRRYQRYQSKSGKWITKIDSDVAEYATPEDMVAAIETEHMQELPKEADGNPMYVPPELKSSIHRRITTLVAREEG
jgi:hypothetical protein